jgi:hypothetical protein
MRWIQGFINAGTLYLQRPDGYSVEQADIFQYQSYSHSDDMFVILKLRNNS